MTVNWASSRLRSRDKFITITSGLLRTSLKNQMTFGSLKSDGEASQENVVPTWQRMDGSRTTNDYSDPHRNATMMHRTQRTLPHFSVTGPPFHDLRVSKTQQN